MADLVTHSRFRLDTEGLANLKSLGVEVLHDLPSEEELGITEPQYGEEVLGTLTEEEYALFVEIWRCQEEANAMAKAMTAASLRSAADMVGETKTSSEFMERVRAGETSKFQTEDDAKATFRIGQKLAFLKSMFYWHMSERFDCHHFATGVRTKRRFVRKERKY